MPTNRFAQDGFLIIESPTMTDEAFAALDHESRLALERMHELDGNSHGAGPSEWREHKCSKVNHGANNVPYFRAGRRNVFQFHEVFRHDFLKRLEELNLVSADLSPLAVQVQYTYSLTRDQDKASAPKNGRREPHGNPNNYHYDSGNEQISVYRQNCLIGMCFEGGEGESAGNFLVWPASQQQLRDDLISSWKPLSADISAENKVKMYADWKQAPVKAIAEKIEPTPISNIKGQTIICHHLLIHGTRANETDKTRRMVFFRIGLKTLTGIAPNVVDPFPQGADLWRNPME